MKIAEKRNRKLLLHSRVLELDKFVENLSFVDADIASKFPFHLDHSIRRFDRAAATNYRRQP